MTSASMDAVPTDSLFKLSVADLVRLLPLVLKRSGLALVSLHFVREMSLQGLSYLGSLVQAGGRENLPVLISLVSLNFLFEILWSAIWSFVLISATRAVLREEPLWTAGSLSNFNQLLIEGVRSMAAILWRLPFAIVPGLIELLRLTFVPHVVLLEPLYSRGQVDALARSRRAIRAKWGLILAVTIASLALTTTVETLTQGNGREPYFWQVPVQFFAFAFLTLIINLVYEVFLVAVFLRINLRLE